VLLTSGKSTQNAFIFNPYRKLAKFSLNLDKLSCINCRCIKLASKSAIESDNSANAGSKASRGASVAPPMLVFPDSRNEDLEEGRKGVVGRESGLRLPEPDRLVLLPACGVVEEDILDCQCSGAFRDDVLVCDSGLLILNVPAGLFARDARSTEKRTPCRPDQHSPSPAIFIACPPFGTCASTKSLRYDDDFMKIARLRAREQDANGWFGSNY
jgi:hypothetical protein